MKEKELYFGSKLMSMKIEDILLKIVEGKVNGYPPPIIEVLVLAAMARFDEALGLAKEGIYKP